MAPQHLIIPEDKEEARKFLYDALLKPNNHRNARPVDEAFEELSKKSFNDDDSCEDSC